jgi:hypothetical protein
MCRSMASRSSCSSPNFIKRTPCVAEWTYGNDRLCQGFFGRNGVSADHTAGFGGPGDPGCRAGGSLL